MWQRSVVVPPLVACAAFACAQLAAAQQTCFVKALLCGETITGELGSGDCHERDGSLGDRIVLTASGGSTVELTATTESIPARLYLRGDALDQQSVPRGGEAVARAGYASPRLAPTAVRTAS